MMEDKREIEQYFSEFLDALEVENGLKRDPSLDAYYLDSFLSLLKNVSKGMQLVQWENYKKGKEADLTPYWEKDVVRAYNKEERNHIFSIYRNQTNQIRAEEAQKNKPAMKINSRGYYEYGRWIQNADEKNTPLEWRIVTENDNHILLATVQAIDCRPFDEDPGEIRWHNSSLYKWLNQEFFETAFEGNEKAAIVSNPDRIFLLSKEEVDEHMNVEIMRQVSASSYAQHRGALSSKENGCCWWWLRSSGSNNNSVVVVYPSGLIDETRVKPNDRRIGVRPAIWIDKAKVLEV